MEKGVANAGNERRVGEVLVAVIALMDQHFGDDGQETLRQGSEDEFIPNLKPEKGPCVVLDWLIDWLIDLLKTCWIDRSVDWLIKLSTAYWLNRLIDWSFTGHNISVRIHYYRKYNSNQLKDTNFNEENLTQKKSNKRSKCDKLQRSTDSCNIIRLTDWFRITPKSTEGCKFWPMKFSRKKIFKFKLERN